MASGDRAARRAVPAARPAGGRAVPPHAAARVPRRDDRVPRARRLRRALPAALGAAGAGRATSTSPARTTTGCARLRVDAPRGSILDRNGHVLVSNVAGTRLELWPADLPKRWPAEQKELRALAPDHRHRRRARSSQKLKQHGVDPLTPVVVQSGLHEDQILYLEEHEASFPGVQLARSWLRRYPYQSLAAQVLGYVGQISPERVQAAEGPGVLRRRLDRPGGRRGDLRQVPARPRRPGPADGRLAGPAEGPAAPGRAAAAGRQPAADDRRRPAARRREGAPLRHPGGARRERAVRRRRRDRRARPERRVGARDGVVPDLPAVGLRRPPRREEARAAARPEGRREGELPGPEPRDRRELSAGLDVQAGHGARRDAGAPR